MDATSQDEAAIAALQARIAELEAAGNDAEAIPVAERWAEAAGAHFGEDHPAYAAALETLGRLLRRAGRLDEAEVLLRRALAIYQASHGAHSLAIARTYGQLAQALYDAGRVEEAEALRGFAMMAPPPDDADAPIQEVPPADLDETAAGPVSAEPPASQPRPAPAPMPRRDAPGAGSSPAPPAPPHITETHAGARMRAEPAAERRPGPIVREKVDAGRALEIDAGRLAYQIPQRMWVNEPETVEVRLGRTQAQGLAQGFGGRGEVRTEDIPIVETMSVTLLCAPGAFDIEARSEKDQLVKPDLVLGTAFHSNDFGRWVWIVTPRRKGEHTLLVKVSAAIRDSRGLPTTSSLPDRTFAVSVRVQILRSLLSALGSAVPRLVWVALTTVVGSIVGILTKDYWWPAIRRLLGWE
jgi:hypothetical protein